MNDSRLPVSLHISLAPGDVPHVRHILPHQMRCLGQVVSEVVLTIDRGPRPEEAEEDPAAELRQIAEQQRAHVPCLTVRDADYSEARREELGRCLLERGLLPLRAYRGAFHAYFDGWLATKEEFLFHLDSDMLLGGGAAESWLAEAISLLRRDRTVLVCSPLPGPPASDYVLRSQPNAVPVPGPRGAHRLCTFTTRIFFMPRARLLSPHPSLRVRRASLRQQVTGWIDRKPPFALPEAMVSEHLQSTGSARIDFLGEGKGLWSLHPPYRTAGFYARLPEIIRRVETDDLPEAQRGDHDLNDSMLDWSEAREALVCNRWWQRLLRRT